MEDLFLHLQQRGSEFVTVNEFVFIMVLSLISKFGLYLRLRDVEEKLDNLK